MKLWILRHGEAHNAAATDPQRELTPGGREQVLRSAAHLLGEPLQAIFVSPYIRAQQTAQLVLEALGNGPTLATVPWLTPGSDPDQVLTQLSRFDHEQVLVVSHQPLVGSLLGLLEKGDRAHQAHPMHTASLAELEGEAPLANLMSLRSLYHP